MANNPDLWWIVVPETTTNLVTNPSLEKATTGYSAVGASAVARSATYQRRGTYSLRVTPTAAFSDGAKYSLTLAAATWYTFSVDIKGVDGISYNLDIFDSVANVILGAPVTFVSDGGWARYAVTAQTGANTAIQVRVYKYSNASVAPFYLDGFQVEAKQYATDYCDGDQDGCLWAAGKHTSASSRQAQFSGAGKVVSLDDYGYQVGPVVGAGMSAVDITVKRPAVQDGAIFRKQSIRERVTGLEGLVNEDNLISYHSTRSAILRLLNPNRFATQQPVHIRYTGSGKMLDAGFYYQGGMDGNCVGCPNEVIPLRLQATDPYWKEFSRIFTAADIANGIGTGAAGTAGAAGENGGGGGNTALAATATQNIAGVNYILQKNSAGTWSKMQDGLTITPSGGADNDIFAVKVSPNGKIYIAGSFTHVDTGLAYAQLAEWDGAGWSDIGGGIGTAVLSMDIAPDGDLFVGGVGAGVVQEVAKYDGAWAYVGDADNTVQVVAVTPDGATLFVGGQFHNIGGVAANHIAKMDIATGNWSAIGVGVDDIVYAITFTSDSSIAFVGGGFHNAGGAGANHIAKLTIASSTWAALGVGVDDSVQALSMPRDGKIIYVGGFFHNAGGAAALHVAQYTIASSAWSPVGVGLDNAINYQGLDMDSRGYLYAGGSFHNSGAVPLNHLGIWNGVVWRDLFTPTRAVIQAQDGKVYIGGGFADADSVANTDKVAYWDTTLSTWNALGTGADDGVVYALAELANGDIAAAGYFSGMGGIATTQSLAVWDKSAGAWTSIGDINGTVLAMAVAPNGDLYIGGLFLDANGVANTQNLAYYDISAATWKAVSAEPDSAVNTLKFDASGKLYIGGSFLHIGATDYDYVTIYNPATDTFSALQNGTNGYVNSIDIAPNGCVYLTGTFTTAGTVTGANYVVAWNGSQFQLMGTGLDNQGYVIKTDAAGLVYIGGAFTTAGGVTLPDKVTVWNGTNYKPLDVDLPGTAAVEAMLFAPTITVLGFDTSGTAVAAYVN